MDEDEILEHYGDDDISIEQKKEPEEKKNSEPKKERFVEKKESPKETPLRLDKDRKDFKNMHKKIVIEKKPEHKKQDSYDEEVKKEENHAKLKKHDMPKKNKSVVIISILAIILIIGLSLLIVFWQDIFKTTQSKDVAAVVNGEIITLAQLEYNYNISVPAGFRALVSQESYLNSTLIPQVLLLQVAKKQGITVSDDEVSNQIDQLLFQSGMTQADFETQLQKQNLTLDDVKGLYKTRLIIADLFNQTFGSGLNVTQNEIQDYYTKNIKDFTAQPGQIRAAHILVQTEAAAQDILKQLQQGADFATLAKANSIDTGSAPKGGDLGFFTKDQMIPEFSNASFALKVNQLSGIVKSTYGYHIIKRLPDVISLNEASAQIEQALLSAKQNAALQTYLAQLRSTSTIQIVMGATTLESTVTPTNPAKAGTTFTETQDPVCMQDGKPIIRLFSTTTCPHCQWIKNTFDTVAKEYVGAGKIVAHHWELDSGDDTLTTQVEAKIPQEEFAIFQKYSNGGVPTFVFGCKYVRIGNGYESTQDLQSEEAEFRQIFNTLTATV